MGEVQEREEQDYLIEELAKVMWLISSKAAFINNEGEAAKLLRSQRLVVRTIDYLKHMRGDDGYESIH